MALLIKHTLTVKTEQKSASIKKNTCVDLGKQHEVVSGEV